MHPYRDCVTQLTIETDETLAEVGSAADLYLTLRQASKFHHSISIIYTMISCCHNYWSRCRTTMTKEYVAPRVSGRTKRPVPPTANTSVLAWNLCVPSVNGSSTLTRILFDYYYYNNDDAELMNCGRLCCRPAVGRRQESVRLRGTHTALAGLSIIRPLFRPAAG